MEPVSNKALIGTPPMWMVELGLTGVLEFFRERRLKQAIKHWGRNPFTDLPIVRFPMPSLVSRGPSILLLLLLLHILPLQPHSESISGRDELSRERNSSGIVLFVRIAWSVLGLGPYFASTEPDSGIVVPDTLS